MAFRTHFNSVIWLLSKKKQGWKIREVGDARGGNIYDAKESCKIQPF